MRDSPDSSVQESTLILLLWKEYNIDDYSVFTYSRTSQDDLNENFNPQEFYTDEDKDWGSNEATQAMSSSFYGEDSAMFQDSSFESSMNWSKYLMMISNIKYIVQIANNRWWCCL